ncbi:MAG TPA: alpha/beta hydrolase [Acidimicrobiales bacterium]|jgi:pimeloyl-ACP methyl ester carboxylesterase|nr:alpha/beta hydrolase [Acidimicrobiales bacterium]
MAFDVDDFPWEQADPRGFTQAFVRVRGGSVPILLVHGWPETARIWWRVIAPLADAGFDVIAPDLRGFGRSEVGPDGFHDVASHALDLSALMRHLGHERFVAVGGDLGGPIIQDLALREPERVDRMVLFNSPLPFDKERMQGMRTRPPAESADYFIRQGTDPDGLAAELDTPDKRRRYVATFYGPRFWAHPGAFDAEAVAFLTEPFGDGAKLRASFGAYESVFRSEARAEPPRIGRNEATETMILFGPSDHVIYPDFDRMAAEVFPNHVGPFLLRDCGHFVQWEAARPLTTAVLTFCRDLLASQS